MNSLVFLEAAAQGDAADALVESNTSVIDFAVSEVDSLVEEQANYTAWNVGEYVEESIGVTYENVADPISDIVVESTSVFADIIACEELTESEKMDAISGWAHIINMGDAEELFEASVPLSAAAGALGGAAGGAVGGMLNGAIAAPIVSMFSKERKAWKALVKQEKEAHKQGANSATLKKILIAKEKARDVYNSARRDKMKKYVKRGAIIQGTLGAAGGAINGASAASMMNDIRH